MRIISFSDLHLEFGSDILPPPDSVADVMVLAGDVITLKTYSPLERYLKDWKKPVLIVMGNHEYYTRSPMDEEERKFVAWLANEHENVRLLLDDEVSIDGVNFFGGTMWTDFAGGDELAMESAQQQMNDFRLIKTAEGKTLEPADTIGYHEAFLKKLKAWLAKDISGPRVVVTHHSPALNPKTRYGQSPCMFAFNSLDMTDIIKKHQPDLWIYGHTHECDDQTIGKTRIISNQLGYPDKARGYECAGFDKAGRPVDL